MSNSFFFEIVVDVSKLTDEQKLKRELGIRIEFSELEEHQFYKNIYTYKHSGPLAHLVEH